MAEEWFVIETKFRMEKAATKEIQSLGFECFMPTEVRKRRDRTKKSRPIVEYEVAMFPRYIFPRFDIDTAYWWERLGRLESVKGWLKANNSEKPRPIRDQTFIERVKQEQIAISAALINDQAIRLDPLPDGTRVTILEGPFATFGGFVNMSHGDRVKVMLDAAGFSALDIARHSVAIAS